MKGLRLDRHGAAVALLGALVAAALAGARGLAQDLEPERADSRDQLLLTSVSGVLDAEKCDRLIERISAQLDEHKDIRTVLLKIDSPGTEEGRIEPAERLARSLTGLKGVRVVAWILQDRTAGNASALVALAAQDIFLSPGARLGAMPPPPGIGGRIEVPDGTKEEADRARKLFREYALLRRGPEGLSHLASCMISRFHPDIFKVQFEKMVGNDSVSETRFYNQEQIQNLGVEDRQAKKPEVLFVPSGQKLPALDPKSAAETGIARAVESDDIHEVIHKLHLTVGDENIIDLDRGGVLKPNEPAVQTLVDIFTHPVARFLLLLFGTLGLLLEFKMPGTLVPSLGALGCFAVFFIASLYAPTGGVPSASLWEVLLFVLGLGLLSVEILLLPGVMVFGISGAAACLLSVVMAMVPSEGSPMDYKDALLTLISSSATSALIFLALLRFLPRSRFFDRSGIVIYSSIQGTPTADTAIEAQTRDAALIGRIGTAVTPLRPAGTAEVDGVRIDVVAEGDFIEKGDRVQVIELDGTRTLVKRA